MESKTIGSEIGMAKRIFAIVALILAGESIFFLPFVVQRVFRGTFLEVFQISNTELGFYFSAYGLVALISYIIGGPIADRYAPSKLIAVAISITSLGGLLLYFHTNKSILLLLYIFWGFSTILIFWSSLLRTTRILFGNNLGSGYGLLESGRGAISALVTLFAVDIFAQFIGGSMIDLLPEDRTLAFRNVILFFTLFTFLVSLIAYFALKPIDKIEYERKSNLSLSKVKILLKEPAIWFHALIILCAYSGYKVSDYFSLIAQNFLGYSEEGAAQFTSMTFWIRPAAAIIFGLLADKIKPSKLILLCFLLMALGGLNLSFNIFNAHVYHHVLFTVCSVAIAVYAVRGLYFAVIKEEKIPLEITGTAIGLASFIGYLPDIFMGPLSGYFVDSQPGIVGLKNLFLFISVLSIVGIIITLFFRRLTKA